MPAENATASPGPADRPAAPGPKTRAVIEVEDLHKTFRIPTHRVDSLKERVVRPFSSRDFRELRALDGISFDVHQGEFFGIVGRNGSGKSTLLKMLASIYRADAGTDPDGRAAGAVHRARRRLQPGADRPRERRPQRRDDGPHAAETRRRLDAVLEFAELRRIRRPEAEELLLGDAGPARVRGDGGGRCRHHADRRGARGRRRRLRAEMHRRLPRDESDGQDDRARHPRDGDRRRILRPRDADPRRRDPAPRRTRRGGPPLPAAELRARQRGRQRRERPRRATRCGCSTPGWRTPTANASPMSRRGRRSDCGSSWRSSRDNPGLGVSFIVANADGMGVFQFGVNVLNDDGAPALAAGERVKVSAEVENQLVAGRYFVHCGVNRVHGAGVALYVPGAVDFVVFGGERAAGIVSPSHEIKARRGRERRGRSEPRPARPRCARCMAPRRSAAAGGASSTCSG